MIWTRNQFLLEFASLPCRRIADITLWKSSAVTPFAFNDHTSKQSASSLPMYRVLCITESNTLEFIFCDHHYSDHTVTVTDHTLLITA